MSSYLKRNKHMTHSPEHSPHLDTSLQKPEFHADTRPDDELPHLDSVSFQALVRMPHELRTPQTLEEFGVDFNNGIQAAMIDGQKVYFNTNEADFGTVVRNPGETLGQAEVAPEAVENVEALESSNEFPAEVKAFIDSFVTSQESDIQDLLMGTTTQNAIQDELATTIRSLAYSDDFSDISVRRNVLAGQLANLQHLKSLFVRDKDTVESELYIKARRFTDESQDLTDAVSRDEATTDDLRHKAKMLLGAAEEINANMRGANLVAEDLVDQTTKLIGYVDNLMNDTWGYEAYVSNINHQLQGLEASLSDRHRLLLRSEAELATLKKLAV